MAYSLSELVTAAWSKFRTLYESATQRHFPLHAVTSDGADVAEVAGGLLSVIPRMTSGGIVSVQTNATGTTWNAFGSQAAKHFTVANKSGTDNEARRGGAGVGLPISDGDDWTFYGLTNISDISVRRLDTSNTQVTVHGVWES